MTESPSGGRLLDVVKQLQLAIRVATDVALADHGLTLTQASALITLEDSGELPCAALARRLGITRQSMQELVTALHTSGLLAKRSDPQDARHIVVSLTASGAKAARIADRAICEIEAQMTSGMSSVQGRRLLGGLRTCLDNLRAVTDESQQAAGRRHGSKRFGTGPVLQVRAKR